MLAAGLCLVSSSALAEQPSSRRETGWSVAGGIGPTASPTRFLMQFDLPYHLNRGFSLGPQLQIGVSGGTTIVSAALDARYDFDFSVSDHEIISKIHPFVNGGLGVTYMQQGPKRRPLFTSNSRTGFLMEFGFGLAYALSERVSLESAMQFNIIPDGAGPSDRDKFYWSWQMAGVRFEL